MWDIGMRETSLEASAATAQEDLPRTGAANSGVAAAIEPAASESSFRYH